MACGLFFKRFSILIFLIQIVWFQVSCNESIPNEYLLPEHHPIKPFLDALFSSRVILNLETLEEAGFDFCKPRKFTNLIIAKHVALPDYIFKLYLDAQRYHKDKPEHFFWMLRVRGAELVRGVIEANHLENWVKVPKKWIYQLPKHPLPPQGYMTKHSLLVEEDMQLLSSKDNEEHWASSNVTPEHLSAIYLILSSVGLSDCAKPDNMPFSVDGRIAFIDTQTHERRVPYENLTQWLSKENQAVWDQLINSYLNKPNYGYFWYQF